MNVRRRSGRSPPEETGVIDAPNVTHLAYRIKIMYRIEKEV